MLDNRRYMAIWTEDGFVKHEEVFTGAKLYHFLVLVADNVGEGNELIVMPLEEYEALKS